MTRGQSIPYSFRRTVCRHENYFCQFALGNVQLSCLLLLLMRKTTPTVFWQETDLNMDCVKSISELEPVYAKKWTGKSLTKAGLSQNFSRQDLAWTGLYLNAYRSRVGLDRLKWPFSHTSLGHVLDENQPGSQLVFLNHLFIVNCPYIFFLCPMCVLCSVMGDVWCVNKTLLY